MYSQSYNERRIKRLEITVVVLSLLFMLSIGISIYSAMQIRTVANSIPSYKEIKEDIKTLNKLYKISEEKVPQAYNYTKEKAIKSYEFSKEKANEFINYVKEKAEKK